jgi:hypothetical protein
MFNMFILRSLVRPFVIWRNPNMAVIATKDSRWTPRQLYLDAKGERAQHKVLQMAVRKAVMTAGLNCLDNDDVQTGSSTSCVRS